MTEKESDSGRQLPSTELPTAAEAQQDSDTEHLSYEGSRVPFFIVALWLIFFVWGVYYLLRWIPESWREWFVR